MALRFSFGHDVDEVVNLLTDPDFLVERNLALGDLESRAEVDEYDDEFVVNMFRKMRVELNPLLAKVFNPEQSMTVEETWTREGDGWTGNYVLKIEGQPVTVTADFSVTPEKNGSVFEISHGCKARIPLVGGKVEKTVLSQTADGAREELEYAKKRLG